LIVGLLVKTTDGLTSQSPFAKISIDALVGWSGVQLGQRAGGHRKHTEATNVVVMIMESEEDDNALPTVVVESKTSDGLRFTLDRRPGRTGIIQFNEADFARVAEEFGSSDPDFLIPILRQIGALGTQPGFWDPDRIRFAIAFIRQSKPRDAISGLLAFHMMKVHGALKINWDRINNAQYLQYSKEEENADQAVNRLTRTLIRLAEAFDRHQTGGEQKLTVRHMAVANGKSGAKAAKRPKRRTLNGGSVINGAANHVEADGTVLLNKGEDRE
jgi:hypothetical protein